MDAAVKLEFWWMLGVVALMVVYFVAVMMGLGKKKERGE